MNRYRWFSQILHVWLYYLLIGALVSFPLIQTQRVHSNQRGTAPELSFGEDAPPQHFQAVESIPVPNYADRGAEQTRVQLQTTTPYVPGVTGSPSIVEYRLGGSSKSDENLDTNEISTATTFFASNILVASGLLLLLISWH